jgi:hypothetical protein
MIEHRHCSGKVSEGKKEKTAKWRRKSIKENSGQMKRDRPLFCFLVIRSFNSRAFSECVCVCVCMQWYMVSTYGSVCALQNSKLEKKGERYHEGWGGERQKRHGVRSAAVVCVCVSSLAVSFWWRKSAALQLLCPFFPLKFLFSLFYFSELIKKSLPSRWQ